MWGLDMQKAGIALIIFARVGWPGTNQEGVSFGFRANTLLDFLNFSSLKDN